ncbi:kinase-like protein [Hysterangium stoloniferum]|nr:kinase-like protein [Hysterangium stoloniferum]
MAPSASPAQAQASPSKASSSSRRPEDDDLKPYIIGQEIGKGSFATVYKGYHEATHKAVAIKAVSRSILTSKLLDNLKSEIDILKQLSHKHITLLTDIVRSPTHIHLIMEFCAGGDLSQYIKRRGKIEGLEYSPSPDAPVIYYPHPRTGGLDERCVRCFLRQLARALKFLRSRNLIHRDIKPQNLLLTPSTATDHARGHPLGIPVLKVADFGFARILPNAMMAETLCGSPLYMAPEILRYEKYDAKADLWSVGAVLYEMSVGKPPFRAQNHIDLLRKIESSKGIKFPDEDESHPNHPLNPMNPKSPYYQVVSPDLKALMRRLLVHHPVERASFDEFFSSEGLRKSKFSSTIPPDHSPTPDEGERSPTMDLSARGRARLAAKEKMLAKAALRAAAREKAEREAESDPEAHVRTPTNATGSNPSSRPRSEASPAGRRPSSVTPDLSGETEEDGLLRSQYVVIKNTELIELDPDIQATHRRRPPLDSRAPARHSPGDMVGIIDLTGSPRPSPTQNTFPPRPLSQGMPSQPISSYSPPLAGALARALNIASKKLFGSRQSVPSYSPPPKKTIIRDHRPHGADFVEDPVEEALLERLEDLAQKTQVLANWADEMFEYVKGIPQKPLPDPKRFVKREGESTQTAKLRRHAEEEGEWNAVTSVALYMLLMKFSQKGLEALKRHQADLEMRFPDEDVPVGEGFDDALMWFKNNFIKCNGRAALIKTWLPAGFEEHDFTWLDQLVYDRALQLSRTAARKELLDQEASDEYERLYEESLWCLYALQDEIMKPDNPYLREDRAVIAEWISRTKLRLERCRARKGMTRPERLKDAHEDANLSDAPPQGSPLSPKPSQY